MTHVVRHTEASGEARAWVERHREHVTTQVHQLPGDGDFWRAKIHCPSPADPDAIICMAATGVGRAGATELARLELHGRLTRLFADGGATVQRARDATVYVHGTAAGVRRVKASVGLRGGPEPDDREVGLAYVGMGASDDVTVGEVATAVLARRHRERRRVPAQGSLL